MITYLSTVGAKLAVLGAGATVGLAAVVVAASVGNVGLTQTATPPDDIEATDVRVESGVGDDTEKVNSDGVDSSFSSDMSVDEELHSDASADGTNTAEGAPDETLTLLETHCGVTVDGVLAGLEYDWSADASSSPHGDTDEAHDFSCEWVDRDGCEISVDFSSDSSTDPDEVGDEDEELNVENDCDDDGDEDVENDDD